MTLQSFHNDQKVKDKYVNRVRQHIKADNLIRGTGWSNGKGCAVGCTLENYNHSRYPIELGVPEWLARVEDTLFEGMSFEKSQTWPLEFLQAIPLGVTEEQFDKNVKAPFMIAILNSSLESFNNEEFPDVTQTIQDCIKSV